MSILGDKLKEIIDLNEINVYQVAKKAGIDRSTIHKIISTERVPSEDYMQKLLYALPITPSEKNELNQAFEIHKVGEYTYTQRNQVKQIISNMATIMDLPLPESKTNPTVHSKHEQEIEVVYGDLFVNNLIEDIINMEISSSDAPSIYFSFPYNYAFFYNYLFVRYSKDSKLKIKCLLEFSKNKNHLEKRNKTLDVLQPFLPFLLTPRPDFDAYYLYSHAPVEKSAISPMPYYLVTSEYVLTTTKDFKTAILYHNEDITKCYKQLFLDTIELAQPLVSQLNNVGETMMFYQNFFDNRNEEDPPFHCIEPQPCILHYCDKGMAEKYVNVNLENREMFVEITATYCQSVKKSMSNAVLIFSKEGLERFMRIKRIFQIPEELITPFDNADILYLINSMIHELETDTVHYRLINPGKMKVSNRVNLDVFSNHCLTITTGKKGASVTENVITVVEDSICSAFQDFALNMLNTDLVCSKEETLKVLYEAVAFIENTG